MKTLEVKQDNAIKAYKGADANVKQVLADLFGSENLNIKITDRVKTFDDVLQLSGTLNDNVRMLLDYNGIDGDMLASQAFMKATLICRVLNEGWVPDWDNGNQTKYYPWLRYKSGVGFSNSLCVNTYSLASVGSRLCLKSCDLAMYAAEQFNDVYNTLFSL